MPVYGPRYLRPGRKIQGAQILRTPLPPFPPTAMYLSWRDLVAVGDGGRLATLVDDGSWRMIELGVKGAWRDGWVGLMGDAGMSLVLVGEDGAIARSTDLESFRLVASGVKGNRVAIAEVGRGRLVALLGDRAIESRDAGLTWKPVTETLDSADLAARLPRPSVGRCLGRIPAEGEVCTFAQSLRESSTNRRTHRECSRTGTGRPSGGTRGRASTGRGSSGSSRAGRSEHAQTTSLRRWRMSTPRTMSARPIGGAPLPSQAQPRGEA